jgi:hypothetical protein
LVQFTRIAHARGIALGEVKKLPIYDYYVIVEDIQRDQKPSKPEF